MKKLTMKDWVEVSGLLFRELIPGSVDEYCGLTLPPERFSAIATSNKDRVDDILITSASSEGAGSVRTIFKSLSKDELIAIFSRWADCHERWTSAAVPIRHSYPPRYNDLWRAIFLSMVADQELASFVAQQIGLAE